MNTLLSAMTPDVLGALALFALASSITPGPNNTMLLASGANFGLKASMPHMLGVSVGFMLLLVTVGAGLGSVFSAYPWLLVALAWVGTLYLIYLAVRIATAKGLSARKDGAQPMRFTQAVGFQAVNPKGWAMSLGAMTAYAPPVHYGANVAIIVAVFGLVNAPCIVIWTVFGVSMRRFLDKPAVLRGFNVAMAAVLILSLAPSLHELVSAR